MDRSLRFLQVTYGIAIAVLLPFVFIHTLQLLEVSGHIFFGVTLVGGLIMVALGLFGYSLGLSLGLMLSGVRCVIIGSRPYWAQIGEGYRFIAALLVLLLMLYAWYGMSRNNKGK